MPDNPMRFDPAHLADEILMHWRHGARQPRLSRIMQETYPGLPLDIFNEAAGVAWSRLTDEERDSAIAESK
jgi:hypothetical protein